MNYGKYSTICCKRYFHLLICNELSFIDPGNQLLIIKKYNEYSYNPAAFKFQCIFAYLLFTVYIYTFYNITTSTLITKMI